MSDPGGAGDPFGQEAGDPFGQEAGDPFGQELVDAFARRRPQGSLKWNFDVALALLTKEFGVAEPDPLAPPGDGEPATASPTVPDRGDGLRGVADRLLITRLRRWVDRRAGDVAAEVTARTLREGLGRTGMAQSVEAMRFLARRVDLLEAPVARRKAPVAASESMVAPLPLDQWLGPVTELARRAGPGGEWLHAECGDGRLVASLRAAGLVARGVEPRGPLAWEAARAGVPVRWEGVGAHLGSVGSGTLGGLVLSGIVDRAAVEDLVELVETAVDRLAPGGALVVIGSDPATALAGWSPVALDLLPGRPLHPETWALLLDRAGLTGVGPLGAVGAPGVVGSHSVVGRRR